MRTRWVAWLVPLLCAGCAVSGADPQPPHADAGWPEASLLNSATHPDSGRRPDGAADAVEGASDRYAHQLDVPFHHQHSETPAPWNPKSSCGPTALLMVLHFLALESKLTPVLQHAAAIPLAEGGYDADCSEAGNPVCTSPGVLARIASEQYGLQVEARDGWGLEDVRAALQQGRPVIADIGGAVGHFVVITGIHKDADGVRLTYSDPAKIPGMVTTWEAFEPRWAGPVDIGDPLQPEGHTHWGMVAYPWSGAAE